MLCQWGRSHEYFDRGVFQETTYSIAFTQGNDARRRDHSVTGSIYIAVQKQDPRFASAVGRSWQRRPAMSALSLELSPSAVARRSRRVSLLARFIAAVQASRMRSARAEIARHRHLLPAEFELAAS